MEERKEDLIRKFLRPVGDNVWSGRKSGNVQDEYWFQKFTYLKVEDLTILNDKDFVLTGYKCDEGVRRNQGRVGAKEGPDEIRSAFGRLAYHGTGQNNLLDLGNIIIHQEMEEGQELLAYLTTQILTRNAIAINLGGGHDIAYGSGMGMFEFAMDRKVGIINIDAHFDLRNIQGKGNSGTPFFQLAEIRKTSGQNFNYLAIGIQKQSNSKALFQVAEDFGARYILDEEIHTDFNAVEESIVEFTSSVDVVNLTIDMDVFNVAHAPGVSAINPMGLEPRTFFKIFRLITNSKKVKLMDIAELNPKYDIDNRTAKLAARILYEFLNK